MEATLRIDDTFARRIGIASPAELSNSALRALVAESYRKELLTHRQVGQILGLDRWETDALLKAAGAFGPHEEEDFSDDLDALRSLAKPQSSQAVG